MSQNFNTKIKQVALLSVLVMAITLVSGCYLELEPYGPGDPNYEESVDLVVDWNFHGSDSPSMCDALNVEKWTVELTGEEDRYVEVDCRTNFWSSENDLLSLPPGHYTVKIAALNDLGHPRAVKTMPLELYATSDLEEVTIDFETSDFF